MLDEYKQIYEIQANLIPNWKKLSKLELCNKYVEAVNNNDDLKDAYLGAVICSFWHIIPRIYYAQQIKFASEEDVYDWFIDGLLCALTEHVWLNPDNSLYKNPDGPEKAICVCIYSAKLNFFKALDCQKRKISKNSLSLDELSENSADSYYLPYYDDEYYKGSYVYNLVIEFFKRRDYFTAFLLDAIINVDVFSKLASTNSYELSDRKLIKHLRTLYNTAYCKLFSSIYDLPEEEVKQGASYIINLTSNRMHENITSVLFLLSKDKLLKQYARS